MMLTLKELEFLREMSKLDSDSRVLGSDLSSRTVAGIESRVKRGYCLLSRAFCMGCPTGETVISVTEAGKLLLAQPNGGERVGARDR